MPVHETIGEKTVLVDMDGVMFDFEEPNNDLIRAHFPLVLPVVDRADFYFTDTYADYEGVVAMLQTENRRPGFFRLFQPVDGAIEGWQRILEAGFTPRVCSSPIEDHATVVDEKIACLEEYFVPMFGPSVIDSAIFDRDKSGYDAIAIIDDRPTLRNIGRAVWQHIIYTRSYNRSVETEFRLEDWGDPKLEHLLARAEVEHKTKTFLI